MERGEAQETADFFTLYADAVRAHGGFDRTLPDDPLSTHVSHKSQRAETLRPGS